jgi:hypothetical protein
MAGAQPPKLPNRRINLIPLNLPRDVVERALNALPKGDARWVITFFEDCGGNTRALIHSPDSDFVVMIYRNQYGDWNIETENTRFILHEFANACAIGPTTLLDDYLDYLSHKS